MISSIWARLGLEGQWAKSWWKRSWNMNEHAIYSYWLCFFYGIQSWPWSDYTILGRWYSRFDGSEPSIFHWNSFCNAAKRQLRWTMPWQTQGTRYRSMVLIFNICSMYIQSASIGIAQSPWLSVNLAVAKSSLVDAHIVYIRFLVYQVYQGPHSTIHCGPVLVLYSTSRVRCCHIPIRQAVYKHLVVACSPIPSGRHGNMATEIVHLCLVL